MEKKRVFSKSLLLLAITSIMLNNSVLDEIRELFRIWIDLMIFPVYANPISRMPMIQGITISFLKIRQARITIVIIMKI